MPTIVIFLGSKPRPQQLVSPRLSQEDAQAQLREISDAIDAQTGTLSLAWCVVKKSEIVAAQLRPDPSMPMVA